MYNTHSANKYDATCCACGHVVKAGEGRLLATKKANHLKRKTLEWRVLHRKNKCHKEVNDGR